MPWKEPGKGDKDPWNSGGQQPPDLEEVFRNVNNRLRAIFGGSGGGNRKSESSGSGGIFGIVLVALLLWIGFETMTTVNVSSVRSLEDRGNMLTEDENLVEFIYKVQYRVASAQDFLFKVRDPELTVKQAAESALRESVGTNRLDAILEGTQRETIRIETQRVLQETLDRYQAGISLTWRTLTFRPRSARPTQT